MYSLGCTTASGNDLIARFMFPPREREPDPETLRCILPVKWLFEMMGWAPTCIIVHERDSRNVVDGKRNAKTNPQWNAKPRAVSPGAWCLAELSCFATCQCMTVRALGKASDAPDPVAGDTWPKFLSTSGHRASTLPTGKQAHVISSFLVVTTVL